MLRGKEDRGGVEKELTMLEESKPIQTLLLLSAPKATSLQMEAPVMRLIDQSQCPQSLPPMGKDRKTRH